MGIREISDVSSNLMKSDNESMVERGEKGRL